MSWRVKSKISNQYSISTLWLDLNTQTEHLDSTQILKSRILTWIKSWRVKNSTRSRWLDSMWSVYIWRDVWSRLLYYVTLIKLVRLFLKLTHSTTSMMKFSLNMMMKKYYIQLFSIARTCFLLNATTKYMIKNFWSSFEHLNTDDLNWS